MTRPVALGRASDVAASDRVTDARPTEGGLDQDSPLLLFVRTGGSKVWGRFGWLGGVSGAKYGKLGKVLARSLGTFAVPCDRVVP